MRRSPRSALGVAGAVAALAVLLAYGGFLLGSTWTLSGTREVVRSLEKTETLAGAARASGIREDVSLAYDDPERAAREMDEYCWSVPNMPTPFVGTAPVPGRHHNATINVQQFRHPVPVVVPKKEGTVRIFVTGGSTAFGVGAPSDEDTIPAMLGRMLAEELSPRTGLQYEVVNASNPAWTSTHERVLIENRLSELQPDVVISCTGTNDAHFSFLRMNTLWFRTYSETHFLRLVDELYEAAIGRKLPHFVKVEPVAPEEAARKLAKNVRLANAALEPVGATYLVCLMPTLPTTGKPLTERERAHLAREVLGPGFAAYFRAAFAAFREALEPLDTGSASLSVADLSDALDERPASEEDFLDAYHFGDRGNRLLARRLLEVVVPLLLQRDEGRLASVPGR